MAKRVFTSLNHPEPDGDGVQRYSLYEVFPDATAEFGRRYERIVGDFTSEEVTAFVEGNGEFDA